MEFPAYINPWVGNGDKLPVTDCATGEAFDVTVVGCSENGDTVIARRDSGDIMPIQGCIYRRPDAYR